MQPDLLPPRSFKLPPRSFKIRDICVMCVRHRMLRTTRGNCRVSGLTPLTLFPVLAPALLVLTTLAAYALATRLWGWEYGLAAAALSGLVLRGPYACYVGQGTRAGA
jgi:hypothetical protein